MDVHIEKMSSSFRTLDSEALLDPKMIDALMRLLMARMDERQQHERTVTEERTMRPSMTSRKVSEWE